METQSIKLVISRPNSADDEMIATIVTSPVAASKVETQTPPEMTKCYCCGLLLHGMSSGYRAVNITNACSVRSVGAYLSWRKRARNMREWWFKIVGLAEGEK